MIMPVDGEEDEDEWEYEYSTTEFEVRHISYARSHNSQFKTYYVTLDLTTPHVPPKKRMRKPPDRRAGKWTNPGLGKQKRHTLPPAPTFTAPQAGESQPQEPAPEQAPDPETDAEGEDEDEDDDAEFEEEQPTAENDEEIPVPSSRPTKLQILDLHSRTPIVSYDGHVYSCSWAENIGTELLFKPHDEKDHSLPGIRTLPGGVDLIAMSSARIVSQSVQLKPNPDIVPRRPLKRLHGKDPALRISVGTGASEKRKEQAAFLERLIDMKAHKGEEDLVTVLAKTRPRTSEWLEVLRGKRAKERHKLTRMIDRGDPDSAEVRVAQARLEEIDAEEEKRENNLEARGLLPDGKRRAKEDDARKRPKMADGSAPPRTKQFGLEKKRGRPRKKIAGINQELEELFDGGSVATESVMAESEIGDALSGYGDMDSPRTEIGDIDEDDEEDEEEDEEEEEEEEGYGDEEEDDEMQTVYY